MARFRLEPAVPMNCPHMRRKDSLVGSAVAWTILVACGRSSLESGSGTASDTTGGQASLPVSIATTSGGSFVRSARTSEAVTAGSGGTLPLGEGGAKPWGEFHQQAGACQTRLALPRRLQNCAA